jgi:hypothetical protein
MDAAQRFPFTLLIKPRYWLAVIVVALAGMSAANANDHADNPNKPDPDDMVPAEIAEPEEAEKAWQEQQVPLPRFPRAQDLIPLRAESGQAGYRYYIDVNSVSLAGDEVMRYTVIIQSPAGASNIIYEGIRCTTQEVKIFAYGTRGGRFERMPEPKWSFYRTDDVMSYRTALVESYVCDPTGWVMDRDTMLERLVLHDPRRARFVPKEADAGN